MRQRAGRSALAMVVASVLAGAGVAWSCTATAFLEVNPRSAAAGSQVTVTGTQFVPDGTVVVHWDQAGGPIAGRASGATFSISVHVPEDVSGIRYLTAVGHDSEGAVAGEASAALEITPSATTSAQRGDADVSEPPSPSTEVEAPPAVRGEPAGGAPVRGASSTSAQRPRAASQTPPQPSHDAGATSAPAPVSAATSGTAETIATSPAPAPSAATARTADANLWSGFTSGTTAGPGLLDLPQVPSRSDGRGLGLGFGLVVLAGMAFVVSGIVMIPARRQRATATNRRQQQP